METYPEQVTPKDFLLPALSQGPDSPFAAPGHGLHTGRLPPLPRGPRGGFFSNPREGFLRPVHMERWLPALLAVGPCVRLGGEKLALQGIDFQPLPAKFPNDRCDNCPVGPKVRPNAAWQKVTWTIALLCAEQHVPGLSLGVWVAQLLVNMRGWIPSSVPQPPLRAFSTYHRAASHCEICEFELA